MQNIRSGSLEILSNTPAVLTAMLHNLGEEWISSNEGEYTWTAKEVVAHLVVIEETDWLPRIRIILDEDGQKTFAPVDMQAHFAVARNHSMQELLNQFAVLRKQSIEEFTGYNLEEKDLQKTGNHPVLGEVQLQQLLATWVTHDLTHIAQVTRVMAKQQKNEVGPFKRYLRILE